MRQCDERREGWGVDKVDLTHPPTYTLERSTYTLERRRRYSRRMTLTHDDDIETTSGRMVCTLVDKAISLFQNAEELVSMLYMPARPHRQLASQTCSVSLLGALLLSRNTGDTVCLCQGHESQRCTPKSSNTSSHSMTCHSIPTAITAWRVHAFHSKHSYLIRSEAFTLDP